MVGSYREIEAKMEEGTSNRTVASTAMNATSSRAHTVVTIQFDQIKKNEIGEETKRTSIINLVRHTHIVPLMTTFYLKSWN